MVFGKLLESLELRSNVPFAGLKSVVRQRNANPATNGSRKPSGNWFNTRARHRNPKVGRRLRFWQKNQKPHLFNELASMSLRKPQSPPSLTN